MYFACEKDKNYWEEQRVDCLGLNCALPKGMLKSYLLVSVNITLFSSRVFVDIIELIGGHTGLRWVLKMTGVCVRERGGRFAH